MILKIFEHLNLFAQSATYSAQVLRNQYRVHVAIRSGYWT